MVARTRGVLGEPWWTSRPTLGGHRVPGTIGPTREVLVDLTSDPGWSPRAGDDRADRGSTGGPHVRPWVVTACRGRSGRPGRPWWTSRPTLGGHRVPGTIGPTGEALVDLTSDPGWSPRAGDDRADRGKHWWTSRPTLGGHPVPGTIGPAGEALVDLASDPGWSPACRGGSGRPGGTGGPRVRPWVVTPCRGRSGRPGRHWWTSRPTLGGHPVPGTIGPAGEALTGCRGSPYSSSSEGQEHCDGDGVTGDGGDDYRGVG